MTRCIHCDEEDSHFKAATCGIDVEIPEDACVCVSVSSFSGHIRMIAESRAALMSPAGSLGGASAKAEQEDTCLSSLDLIEVSGRIMPVTIDGELFGTGRVFNDAQVARMLHKRTEVLVRWRARGLFPQPLLRDRAGALFYADVEVCDFVRIVGVHLQRAKSFEMDHVDVRKRLHECSFKASPCSALDWLGLHASPLSVKESGPPSNPARLDSASGQATPALPASKPEHFRKMARRPVARKRRPAAGRGTAD